MLAWTLRTLLMGIVAFLVFCAMGAVASTATGGGLQPSHTSPVVIPGPERPSIELLDT